MQRREFITLLGGAAAAWPHAAGAQQAAMPVVGYLSRGVPGIAQDIRNLAAFRQGLNDTGFVEGRNVAIEYRYAEDQYDRLPTLVAELVRRRIAVIMASSNNSVLAAKAATTTIPIVFATGSDPVEIGAVTSLNRPSANVTGVSWLSNALEPKRLGLLRLLVPHATAIGVLVNPNNANAELQLKDLKEAARTVGLQLHFANARNEGEFEPAFADLARQGAGGVLVATDGFFQSRNEQLIALAARHAMPAIYFDHEFATSGGLMS